MATLDPAPMAPADDPASPRRRLAEAAMIGMLALVLNLSGNGRVSLWDRDEPRYAVCTREMLASGDWLRPTFNAQPRYDKPILIYWLMMAGSALGGDNPFGARLVSAFAGAATCLVVWSLGRRMLGARAGLFAALILATTPLMVAESKLSTTDAALTLWLIGAQACLWELGRRPSRWAAAGFWILMALAVLTKGPIGPAWIAVSGLFSWWWGGPTACWKRLHWRPGLLGFAILTAPWFLAIGYLSRGEFFRVSLGYHVFERVTRSIEQHGAFPGFYALSALLTLHPWSALLPAALVGAWLRRRSHPAFGFLLGWVVGPWILLEIARTKLVHYYLPAYPACALLTAWMIGAVARDEVNLRRWPLGRLALGLLGGVGIATTAALIAGVMVLPWSLRWPCLALALPIGAGTLIAIERFQNGATERAAAVLIAAWALVGLVTGGWLLPALEPYRFPRLVGERLAAVSSLEGARPMLCKLQEPSIIYTLGRPAVIIRDRDDLIAKVRREPVVITLMPEELAMVRYDRRLRVEWGETLEGINLSKGQKQRVHFALIRAADSAVAARPEPSLVK